MAHEKILIVVDDATSAQQIRETLTGLGCKDLKTVSRGGAAVSALKRAEPMVVFLDINLPGRMNGVKTAEKIRRFSDAAIVFLADSSQNPLDQNAKAMEPYLCLSKPISEREVAFALEMARYKRVFDTRLKESETRFRTLVENASEAIAVIREYKIVYASPKTRELTGYTEQELLGVPFIEFIHPHDRDMVMDRYTRRIRGEDVAAHYEFRVVNKDGSVRWVEIYAVQIIWMGEHATLNILNDATKRKQTEDLLRESESRYRRITDSLTDYIFTVTVDDRKAVKTVHGPACAGVTGYSAEDFARDAMLWISMVQEEDRDLVKAQVDDIVNDRAFSAIEHRIIRKDGKVRWVRNTPVPHHDESGRLISYDGLMQDITDRKLADEAMRESMDIYKALFETSPDPIVIYDLNGDFMMVNNLAARIYGVESAEQFIGEVKNFMLLMDESGHTQAKQRIANLMQGMSVSKNEYAFKLKNGSIGIGEVSTSILFDRRNKPMAFLSIVHDITKRRRIEEALRESEEKYRAIVENTADYIMRYDRFGRHIFGNPAALKVTGVTLEEYIGKTHRDLGFPEALCEYWEKNIEKVFQTGEVQTVEFEVELMGAKRYLQLNLCPEMTLDKTVRSVIGVSRDFTQRKEAEESLRESEERFRSLVEHMLDAMVILDFEGGIMYANPAAAILTSEKDINNKVGESITRFIHPDSLETFMADLARIRKGREIFLAEYRMMTKDGTPRWAEGRGTKITYQGREADLVLLRDVTERRQMQDAVHESEERFRTLVENAPDAVFVQTRRNFDYVNKAALTLFGAKWPEQLLGMPILERFHPDFHDQVDKRMRTLNEKREKVPIMEEICLRLDGTPVAVEISAAPLNYQGNPGSIVFARNITERKEVEIELRKLASAMEQADECVVITDSSGAIQYVNPAFEKITGYTRDDAIGQNPRMLKSGMQDEAFYKELWEVITSGRTWSGRMVNRRKNGTLYYEEASISPIRDKAGNIVSYVAVKKDITKEVDLEEQLLRSQKLEAIGTLAGGIAHDFNNILSAIIGFSEVVKEEVPRKSPAFAHIIEVLRAGERAKDLVRQILTFSRQVETTRAPVKVQLIARETIKLLRSSIPKNIAIIDLINPKAAPVEGDPTKIHQVIMNLCTNAYHAMMPEGGELTVSLTTVDLDEQAARGWPTLKAGPHLCLKVIDTGCGMDDATVKRIFDPFFTTKEKGKGTGLGLAMVYGIITELGGVISVASFPGHGSAFTVYLPVTERLSESKGEEFDEDETVMESGRILVVDDEESIIHFTQIMLEQLGYTVTALKSGTDALTLFRADPDRFDLIMIDQVMPEMNGTRLAVEILKIRPEMPIILMTGYSETIDREGAHALGIKEYLEKPFTKKAILQIIRRLLG